MPGFLSISLENIPSFQINASLRSFLFRITVNHLYYYFTENTNTSGGLRVLRQRVFSEGTGDRIKNAKNVVIVITDGQSTYDRHMTIPEANALKVPVSRNSNIKK